MEQPSIEWEKFETDYVLLETGRTKKLKLSNWQQGTWFAKPGLRFDVAEEDGQPAAKMFNTTSKRLIRELKPIIQKAEEKGLNVISVSILRVGEGLSTLYEVRENAEDDIPAKVD